MVIVLVVVMMAGRLAQIRLFFSAASFGAEGRQLAAGGGKAASLPPTLSERRSQQRGESASRASDCSGPLAMLGYLLTVLRDPNTAATLMMIMPGQTERQGKDVCRGRAVRAGGSVRQYCGRKVGARKWCHGGLGEWVFGGRQNEFLTPRTTQKKRR